MKARAVNIMTLPATLGAWSPVMVIVRFDPEIDQWLSGCLGYDGSEVESRGTVRTGESPN